MHECPIPSMSVSMSEQRGETPPTPLPRRGFVPTWAKLLTYAVLANLAGGIAAVWIARLIRAVPASADTQSALLFVYWAALVLTAIADAMLADELLFNGAFRKQHLSKLRKDKDRPVAELATTMRPTTLSFPMLLMVGGGITYVMFNSVNNDFGVYFRNAGHLISTLHHGDDAEQIVAIQELSIRREREVLPALKWRLAQGGPPARWAAWALGRFTDLPTRRPLKPVLVAASRSTDPWLRREALVALGRIQHRAAAKEMHIEIAMQREAGETVDPRLMYALGAIQVMSSVPILEDLLHTADVPTQRLAAWALAQHRDQRGGRVVVKMIESRLATAPHKVRCAAVHALGILRDERSNLALMQAYDAVPPEQRTALCPRWQLSMRPDGGPDDRKDLFMPEDVLAMQVVISMAQMRATDPAVRAEVEPWLERVSADAQTPPEAAESFRVLLAGIREGQDDTQLPSVEQALKDARAQP